MWLTYMIIPCAHVGDHPEREDFQRQVLYDVMAEVQTVHVVEIRNTRGKSAQGVPGESEHVQGTQTVECWQRVQFVVVRVEFFEQR